MSDSDRAASRGQFLAAAAAGAALTLSPAFLRSAFASDEPFKIGLLIPLSGPASLFGAGDKACAELAIDQVNATGGIMGRRAELRIADGGTPPADAAKAAVKLLLDDRIDLLVGSHDSAVREAVNTAIKGKIPYVYTPVYEGGACDYNTYNLGETPAQQNGPVFASIVKQRVAKRFYLIGDDYVWPRTVNAVVKKYIAKNGGSVVGEEYVPLGGANKFEEVVTRIKSAKPDMVMITLVGADNVGFNKTFASFGLDAKIARVAFLLEENTLAGIGAEASHGLYSCMGYFANITNPANVAFKKAYRAKAGAAAPQLSTLGVDCYAGVHFAKALVDKAGGTDAAKCISTSEGLHFTTAAGQATLVNRGVSREMYVAECKGAQFAVVSSERNVAAETGCPST